MGACGEHGRDRERGSGPEGLEFPDLRRMELDELLGQLVERAQEVMGTQGRLRGLLRASQAISTDLSLSAVLRRIVDAAQEVIGARYAALGVIGVDGGGLVEFVHTGMPADEVTTIGHLPQGKGLLGALIDDPRPIRTTSIGDDARSSGFPAGHPPMGSFLGVPIRIREEVYGNLYLSESDKGEFTAEDEELALALAASAGAAIENARLYEAGRARQAWLSATAEITRKTLSGEAGQPLDLIATNLAELAAADAVVVARPDEHTGGLRIDIAQGHGADGLRGFLLPLETSLCGEVLRTGEPRRVESPGKVPGLISMASLDLDLGPMLALPLQRAGQVDGVLAAARVRDRPGFTVEELNMATAFANQASIAIELAESREEQQRLAMLDDRDRIAADLHDQVIQRLFAVSLSLQSVVVGLGGGPHAQRIQEQIDNLDATVRQIRTTIFDLQASRGGTGIRSRILDVATELDDALGFRAAVSFSGLIEDRVPTDVAEDLVAVLREALTNVARHACAHSVEVDVVTDAGQVALHVADDGAGIPDTGRRSGLANMRRRAERHGGQLVLENREQGGTRVSWTVPLGAD